VRIQIAHGEGEADDEERLGRDVRTHPGRQQIELMLNLSSIEFELFQFDVVCVW
jgi:hypothetical protein